MTSQQPLWWDEAEYMSIAKHFAYGINFPIGSGRLIFFPLLATLLLKIGLGEVFLRFLLELIPSVLIVLFTYLFVKEMYGKEIALVASIITSVCWIHIFYSMRLMTDELGFLFGLVSLFLFWKGYVSGKNNKLIYFSAFFIALSFLIRPTGAVFAIILFVFLFISENFRIFKKKELWLMPLIFLLTISLYLLWSFFKYGDALSFLSGYGGAAQGTSILQSTFGMLSFIYIYPEKIFFVFFLVGLLSLFSLFLSLDKIIKGEKKYQNDLLMILSILIVQVFFIYFLRTAEDRWLMAMSLGIFVFSAKGIYLVFEFSKKNFGKYVSIFILLLIIGSGGYFQLAHADSLIKNKLDSYSQVKEAGLWIKENSQPSDSVFSKSWPQITYYSERETFSFYSNLTGPTSQEDLIKLLEERKPKFFMLSIFEPHEDWMLQIPQNYPQVFIPIKSYAVQNQTILVIYKIDYTKL